jgi:predicted helicase
LPATDRPADTVRAAHIDGRYMPRSKRNQLIATFSQANDRTHRLLSNVKLLTEGVDVPGIDAITMIDTTRGPAQVIQIVGRAVRISPGKTVGSCCPCWWRKDRTRVRPSLGVSTDRL